MKFLAALLALSALLGTVAASPADAALTGDHVELDKRAGPSGSLVYPPGNTVFVNKGGKSKFRVEYKQVSQTNAQTYSIDVNLQSVGGSETAFTAASGLSSNSKTDNIKASFSPAPATCGQYRIVINENQVYNGQLIRFQAAAPLVTFQCT